MSCSSKVFCPFLPINVCSSEEFSPFLPINICSSEVFCLFLPVNICSSKVFCLFLPVKVCSSEVFCLFFPVNICSIKVFCLFLPVNVCSSLRRVILVMVRWIPFSPSECNVCSRHGVTSVVFHLLNEIYAVVLWILALFKHNVSNTAQLQLYLKPQM